MYLDKLRELCVEIAPNLKAIIEHDSAVTASTWNASGETGKAVEFFSLCCLMAALSDIGRKVYTPDIYQQKPDLFYLRNILHRHYGAQAGHAASINSISLIDRFSAALTPKVMFENGGLTYGIFREGMPVHLVEHLHKGKPEYLDRPDLIVCEGTLTHNLLSAEKIEFKYECQYGVCHGVLRIKNDPNIPIISYETTLTENIPVIGIIECSVSKGDVMAEEQLQRYISIFSTDNVPISLLINGRRKKCPAYNFEAFIDMGFDKLENITTLSATMQSFAKALTKSL
jgi:hypothetical protein